LAARTARREFPTLRISRLVLEDYPAFALLEHIARLRVAGLRSISFGFNGFRPVPILF
jgi:hypothetical protein